MQIALKFILDKRHIDQLVENALIKKAAPITSDEQLISETYFDTPGLAIRQGHADLCIRQMGQTRVQTLRISDTDEIPGNFYRWQSCESLINDQEINGTLLRQLTDRKTAFGKLFNSKVFFEELQPIFRTKYKRTAWQLFLPDGAEITCLLDIGQITHGEKTSAISEVAIELNRGEPTQLIEFALSLLKDVPLHIGQLGKVDRGYALYKPQPPLSFTAIPLKLNAHMSIPEAFHCIVSNCMSHIQANAAGVTMGSKTDWNAECLHQMRVGVRRLRTVLPAFIKKRQETQPETKDLKHEIIWLEKQLGPARDWDVLTENTLPNTAQSILKLEPDNNQLTSLLEPASIMAEAMHSKASGSISSMRYAKLILQLNLQLQQLQIASRQNNAISKKETSLGEFSRKLLEKKQRRLHKRNQQFVGINPTSLHKLRIATKKFRYATDFFHSLYPKNKMRKLLKRMASVQDILGAYNDVAVAKRLLNKLQASYADITPETNFVSGFMTARVNMDKLRKHKLWKKIITTKFR